MVRDAIQIHNVNPDNVDKIGIFCIKNKRAEGFKKKIAWFKENFIRGLRMKVVTDEKGKQIGFIEYMPSEQAWRPIQAREYDYIQCIAIFAKDNRRKNIASTLIQECESEARARGRSGICSISSAGPWMANKNVFLKNGFSIVDRKGRFELMSKKFNTSVADPCFSDWPGNQKNYKGWNLIYADQCPWHEKSVTALLNTALDFGIDLKVKRLNTPNEAQQAPSGFGTFSLIKDDRLLEDHYLSKTRFKTILKEFAS